MKIAMVSMNAGPLSQLGGIDGGGQSVVVDCLSDELARAGHEVTVYTARDDRALPECLTTAAGVHIHHLETPADANGVPSSLAGEIERVALQLAAQWDTDPPDIVHAHSWMSGSAAAAAALRLGIPLVQTFHGLSRSEQQRRAATGDGAVRTVAEAALVRSAERIIATSSAEVFELLGVGANPGAIKLIPCGVDLELFKPAAPEFPAVDRGVFRIVTLGRLTADAGVGDAIEALRFVEDVELVVAGGRHGAADVFADPAAVEFAALARERGVASRVTFAGRIGRDAVAAFLRSADALVCAPWHGSIGTVALEAMACGVPVIVSAVGALVDAVSDGMTGMHVPPRSPRQIAYAIGTLKADGALRERLVRFGIERVRARYGWPRIATETFAVYASVAGRTSHASRSRA